MSGLARITQALEDEIDRQVANNGGHFVPRDRGKDWIAFDGNLDLTPLVRAVIEEIRAASPAMAQAGAEQVRGIRTTSTIHANAVWQAMIDAVCD